MSGKLWYQYKSIDISVMYLQHGYKNYMKKNGLILLFSLLLLQGCSTMVRINTDKPMDDFFVRCAWHSDFLSLHGGAKQVKVKKFIASSGKDYSCGTSLYGDGPLVTVSHPLYMITLGCIGKKCRQQEGKTIFVKPRLKMDYLNELENKFHKGEIKTFSTDNFKYGSFAKKLGSLCTSGFPHYLARDPTTTKSDIERLKKEYYEPILQCRKKVHRIITDKKIGTFYRNLNLKRDPVKNNEKTWEKFERKIHEKK